MLLLPPQIESLFNGSHLLGVAIVAVRTAPGAVAEFVDICFCLTSEIRGEKSPVPQRQKVIQNSGWHQGITLAIFGLMAAG